LYTGIIYLLTAVCTEAIHFSSIRCISQDFLRANQFHVLPASKAYAEIPAASKKSREQRLTRLLLQPYRQSQKKPVRSENIVSTIGKHISTIAQNSSAL
jgi:hypothetical protein